MFSYEELMKPGGAGLHCFYVTRDHLNLERRTRLPGLAPGRL
jgi:hypothetical protein